MPTVGGRITLSSAAAPRSRARGLRLPQAPAHDLHARACDPRSVLLHELGHLYDLRVMNNSDRGRFRRIMRARKRAWWSGRIPLAEQFAEAYSFCARYAGSSSIARYSTYEYRPSGASTRVLRG